MDVRPLREREVGALHDDCWLPFALEMQELDAHDELAADLEMVREANVAYRRDRHAADDTHTVVAVPERDDDLARDDAPDREDERRAPEAGSGVDPDLDAPVARDEPAAFAGYSFAELGESPPVFARGDPVTVLELYVRPEYRGDGLAHDLLDAVEDWGRDRGCERAELHVSARNEAAQAVYDAHGYDVFMQKRKHEF